MLSHQRIISQMHNAARLSDLGFCSISDYPQKL